MSVECSSEHFLSPKAQLVQALLQVPTANATTAHDCTSRIKTLLCTHPLDNLLIRLGLPQHALHIFHLHNDRTLLNALASFCLPPARSPLTHLLTQKIRQHAPLHLATACDEKPTALRRLLRALSPPATATLADASALATSLTPTDGDTIFQRRAPLSIATAIADGLQFADGDSDALTNCTALSALRRLADEAPPGAAGENLRVEVARGVGNVAAVTSDIYVIAEEAATNGLVGMLGEWATTTTGLAQTEAWRALHNLQEAFFVADGMERVRYTDGLLPLRAPNAKWERERRGCEGGCDVVFVHGVWGKPLGTWCGGNGVWPRDMLTREIEGRVMTFQHDAGAVRIGEPSLAERAKKLQQALAKAQVGRRAVVFVTHSYGGILVKEAVVGRKEAFKGLKGVIFFATPHFGAPVARVPALLSRALHALCEERELQMLNDGFLQTVRQQGVEVVSFAEGIGVGGRGGALVVPVASADPGVGSFFIVPDVDHSAVCKVNEADDWRYRLVLDVIRRAELGPPTDP